MRTPNFDELKAQALAGTGHLCRSYASRLHPNPRYYKYRWWVFWRGSSCDGLKFLDRENSMCTADAMKLMDWLVSVHECHWVYNTHIPRHEPGVTPFDPNSTKWRGHQFESPLDQDGDPLWNGFR